MKYKEFIEKAIFMSDASSEYNASGAGVHASARDATVDLHQIEKPEAVCAINAFIESFFAKEVINPKNAMGLLKSKLNTVGLDFDFDPRNLPGELEEYNLTQFGGRYGWDMEQGDVVEDDGISHRNGGVGMKLSVNYNKQDNGMYMINARIENAEDSE